MSARTTRAPRRASRVPRASPIPDAPPVMMAVWPDCPNVVLTAPHRTHHLPCPQSAGRGRPTRLPAGAPLTRSADRPRAEHVGAPGRAGAEPDGAPVGSAHHPATTPCRNRTRGADPRTPPLTSGVCGTSVPRPRQRLTQRWGGWAAPTRTSLAGEMRLHTARVKAHWWSL
jgi:hypothetical protein